MSGEHAFMDNSFQQMRDEFDQRGRTEIFLNIKDENYKGFRLEEFIKRVNRVVEEFKKELTKETPIDICFSCYEFMEPSGKLYSRILLIIKRKEAKG